MKLAFFTTILFMVVVVALLAGCQSETGPIPSTPSPSPTTASETPTTQTPTRAFTPVLTPTQILTPTPAFTPTPTSTQIPTPTPAFTPTPTPTQIPTPTPPPCPRGTPPLEIIQYKPLFPNRKWDRIPNITVSAQINDPRIKLVHEAVDYWNRQLAEIGTPFRLGSIIHTTILPRVDFLKELYSAYEEGQPRPKPAQSVQDIPGDLLIVLSDGDFVSFATLPEPGERSWVCIRGCEVYPFNLTNVARNVIAHELGHAIGLAHNNDPTKLMCGRPAECRPIDFHCDVEQYFPLTEDEKAYLLQLYPITWEPTQ